LFPAGNTPTIRPRLFRSLLRCSSSYFPEACGLTCVVKGSPSH
jgi:hypothetical protein